MYTRDLTHKDHQEFYTLAYKSFVERNDITIDFDKTRFNNIVKNTLVHESHKTIGLFDNDILIGFAVIMLENVPFSGELVAVFDLVHTDVAHRTVDSYQLIMNAVWAMLSNHKIKRIALNAKNILLEDDLKKILLRQNNFYETSVNWEKLL
jgi:hypothetical protein